MNTIDAKNQRLIDRALRVLEDKLGYGVEREKMTAPHIVKDYLRLRFAGLGHEEFHVLFLDAQNRLIKAEAMFRGTLSQTAVHPREIVKAALFMNAASIIVAHNHPSGVAEPSQADRSLTSTLQRALAYVDVPVVDHIIVGGASTFSFSEAGIL